MSEFNNFKGLFFEVGFERYLTAEETTSFDTININSGQPFKKRNYSCGENL
jgi:hypothetical protein